jgi:hypothetical protein
MRSKEEIRNLLDQETKAMLEKQTLKVQEKIIRDKYNKKIDALRYEIEKLQNQKAKELKQLLGK